MPSPKFLAYLVILCFEKRHPKQKYCFSPKVKDFGPPPNLASQNILNWLRHCYQTECCSNYWNLTSSTKRLQLKQKTISKCKLSLLLKLAATEKLDHTLSKHNDHCYDSTERILMKFGC